MAPLVSMVGPVGAAGATADQDTRDIIVRSQCARRNVPMEADALVPTDVPVSMGSLVATVRLTTGQDHVTGV